MTCLRRSHRGLPISSSRWRRLVLSAILRPVTRRFTTQDGYDSTGVPILPGPFEGKGFHTGGSGEWLRSWRQLYCSQAGGEFLPKRELPNLPICRRSRVAETARLAKRGNAPATSALNGDSKVA